MTHELKCWSEFFMPIWRGEKLFEVRRNDRAFQVGDILHFREFYPTTETYSGRSLLLTISYILPGGEFGVESGYCVLGLTCEGRTKIDDSDSSSKTL